MSVNDRESGIVADHISKLQEACKSLNVFLFIRPTEYDSTRLIQQGYATKSMSVHDKSSNWGPTAGFVPCDQFFSKKFIGQPTESPKFHDHGPAKVVQLRLTDDLVTNHDKIVKIEGKPHGLDVKYYKAKNVGNQLAQTIEFRLEKKDGEWDVFWVKGEKKVPLYVWGYVVGGQATPVTGDYDLWMVAPHLSWWKLHLQVVGVQDEHGSSCATLLNTWLLNKLNEACDRKENPVFNHGAEAQNYGFTQAIDSRLAMFTPAGGSRMIERSKMPQILVDLQNAGYLIYWNKRYGETDPRLGGKGYEEGAEPAVAAMVRELGGLIKGKKVLEHLAKKDQRLRDIMDIRKFYAQLRSLDQGLAKRGDPVELLVGDAEDLPSDYVARRGEDDTLEAQVALQKAVINFTVGGGESNLDQLEDWIDDNIKHVAKLCEAYGPASGAGESPESVFLLEKIPGTQSYQRAGASA